MDKRTRAGLVVAGVIVSLLPSILSWVGWEPPKPLARSLLLLAVVILVIAVWPILAKMPRWIWRGAKALPRIRVRFYLSPRGRHSAADDRGYLMDLIKMLEELDRTTRDGSLAMDWYADWERRTYDELMDRNRGWAALFGRPHPPTFVMPHQRLPALNALLDNLWDGLDRDAR